MISRNGRLAYIAADIVVENVDVDIKVDRNVNANVDAKLSAAVGKILAKDSEVSLSATGANTGEYHLKIKGPVVLAVQTRKQPAGGTLAAGDNAGQVIKKSLPRPKFN